MSKKVIKDEFVKSKKLEHFGLKVYETVERGEKPKKLEKVGEMEYTPGEIHQKVTSFDDDIKMGRAVIVQDRGIKTEKYAPQQFSEEEAKPINEKKEEPEAEEIPPEPEIPAITEEDVQRACADARKQAFADGKNQGIIEGKQQADRQYEAEKADYLAGLQNTYNEVISSVQAFTQAVSQLDEALPEIIINMVRDIVGEERKINDDIVASIAKKSLSHLRELEKIVFLVNPADVESMNAAFPDYDTQPDKNVIKGSLKVSTNIGEMNFSIERMLAEFVDRIHEEFSPTEES